MNLSAEKQEEIMTSSSKKAFSLEAAAALLAQATKHFLVDDWNNLAEYSWILNGVEIASGYSRYPGWVALRETQDYTSTKFTGHDATKLFECGKFGSSAFNDVFRF